jgi:hypothetical protein
VRQAWRPNARKWAKFVTAVGRRYSGRYRDEDTGRSRLPRVSFWGLYNEPNQAGWLAPQWAYSRIARTKIPTAPMLYRKLYFLGRRALDRTGHGRDVILLGETAPLGKREVRPAAALHPGVFLRELLCVDSNGNPLRGRSARARKCSDFDKYGPLRATAFGHHPYTKELPPTERDSDKDSITMANINDLPVLLDRYAQTGRIASGLPVMSTEFGYETNPPDKFEGQPLDKQAEWLNIGDYLAWLNPRVLSQTQFILDDVPPVRGEKRSSRQAWYGYQSGLFFRNGRPKPAAFAYMLPFIAGITDDGQLGVWGQLRFRPNGIFDQVTIERQQFDGSWQAVGDPVQVVSPAGFFSGTLPYPGPGNFRAHWTGNDPPFDVSGRTVTIR